MFFPTFIEPIGYNCRDNRNKLVFYHCGGQIKKILKKIYSLLKSSFQRKTRFIRKAVKWFLSQVEWQVFYDASQMTSFCSFLEKALSLSHFISLIRVHFNVYLSYVCITKKYRFLSTNALRKQMLTLIRLGFLRIVFSWVNSSYLKKNLSNINIIQYNCETIYLKYV